jgi:NDP-sugar pyrophosphorylase family protein
MRVRAIILAGGLGTRLRPVVKDRPKVMSDVGGRPFLELVVDRISRLPVESVTLAVGYGGEHIRRHFGDGSAMGVTIHYSDDGARLRGTGGAVAHAIEHLPREQDDLILVANGDTYLDYGLDPFFQRLEVAAAKLVLAVVKVDDVARYGAVRVNGDGSVLEFEEKGVSKPGLINAGLYCARRDSWRSILPAGPSFSLERHVLPSLAGRGLFAVECTGLFIDIGVPSDYLRAQTLLRSSR